MGNPDYKPWKNYQGKQDWFGNTYDNPGNKDGSSDHYREELTFDEFDDEPWRETKQFGVDDKYEDEPLSKVMDAVKKYHNENGGTIYTQVDSDSGERVYVKGLHHVNATGVFEVVRK